jgi:hypothetical protein
MRRGNAAGWLWTPCKVPTEGDMCPHCSLVTPCEPALRPLLGAGQGRRPKGFHARSRKQDRSASRTLFADCTAVQASQDTALWFVLLHHVWLLGPGPSGMHSIADLSFLGDKRFSRPLISMSR